MERIGNAQLHLGDCLEIMLTLPAGSVDMVLADLPYGVTACEWDKVLPFDRLWAEYERVLKPTGVVALTATQPFASRLIQAKEKWFKYDIIWRKSSVTGFLNAHYQPLRNHENILVFSPASVRKMTYNPQGLVPVDRVRSNSRCRIYGKQKGGTRRVRWTNFPRTVIEFKLDQEHLHPTQKPVSLMAYLILTYSNPGDVVLDNTMGSASTGVAALQVGRRFVGIEKSAEYFQVARERIQRVAGVSSAPF